MHTPANPAVHPDHPSDQAASANSASRAIDPFTAAPLNGAVRLSDWGLIEANGEDAASFLHSQLTQSMLGMTPQRARLAGYCSPKGRLLASFLVWHAGPQRVALACSADLLAPTLKRLSMFVLRAKCKLTHASGQTALWGLVGQEAAKWLGEAAASAPAWHMGEAAQAAAGRWLRLPDVRGHSRWVLAAPALESGTSERPPLNELPMPHWQWLEVCSAIPRVSAATAEHFVPQMINLEVVGGVDFQKGCYPGQEIVARSQYRGTLKRRMVLMRANAAVQVAAEVFHASDPGQPAGEIVLSAAVPNDSHGAWHALVEIKLAAVAAGPQFSCAGVDMEVEELPYPLPAQEP